MSIVYVGNNANNHTTEPMSASIFKPKTIRMKSEKKIDSDAYINIISKLMRISRVNIILITVLYYA